MIVCSSWAEGSSVDRTNRPAVAFEHDPGPAGRQHRLDREHEPGGQARPRRGRGPVEHGRLLVHRVADPVAGQLAQHAEPTPAGGSLDRRADVAQGAARLRGMHARLQRGTRGRHQAPAPGVHRSCRDRDRGVRVIAPDLGRHVQRHQLPGAHDSGARDAVHHLIVDRYAHRARVVVGEDRARARAMAGEHLGGEPIQIARAHARRDRASQHPERLRHDATRASQAAQLLRRVHGHENSLRRLPPWSGALFHP